MSRDHGASTTAQPPVWGVAASVAWLVLSFLAGAAATVVAVAFWLGGSTPADLAPYTGVVLSLGLLVSTPVNVGILVLAAHRRGWAPRDYLALHWPRRGEIIVGVGAVVLLGVLVNAVLYLTGRDIVTPFQIEIYRTARDAGWLIPLWIAVVVLAPISEEIAFRGFLYRSLATPGREPMAIAVIAVVWTILHTQYDWVGLAQVFIIGVMLGWFRWASGSTTLAILMHGLINLQSTIETVIGME